MEKMKKIVLSTMLATLALAFSLACLPAAGLAQNEPTVFAIVDFMKVKPADEAKYLEVEKNTWKLLHQERVKQGKITGWILYRVAYTGSNDPYNYVTVTFFDHAANLENPWEGVDIKKVLSGVDVDKAFDETLKSRDLVKSNLIMRYAEEVPPGGSIAKYIEVGFMKVKSGNEGLYIEVEKNIWKPVHKEFIKAGSRVGWSLWGQVFPSGSASDYQFLTANLFSDFSKIGTADYVDAFKKAHPGQDADALSEKTAQSRDLVRSELWEIVDSVWK